METACRKFFFFAVKIKRQCSLAAPYSLYVRIHYIAVTISNTAHSATTTSTIGNTNTNTTANTTAAASSTTTANMTDQLEVILLLPQFNVDFILVSSENLR